MLLRRETFFSVKMTWCALILYSMLLHGFSTGLCISDVALPSQNLSAPEDLVVNANVQNNSTEQFIRFEDESDFPSKSVSAFNNSERGTDGEHWDFDRVSTIWDPIVVSRIWKNETYQDAGISLSCGEDLTRYLAGASKRANWALRMMDADGRRTWGIFSGNTFWLGDVNQCREMENEFAKWQKDERLQRSEKLPPFHVSMNSVSFAFDILQPRIAGARNITLGLCLPLTCSTKDVERLLYFVQTQSDIDFPLKITINYIRNLSTGYAFWDDTTFHILLYVGIIYKPCYHMAEVT